MIKLINIMLLTTGLLIMASCARDRIANNGYYSTGESVTTYYDPATVGYNRDYQPTSPGNNGYSSSGSSRVRTNH